MKRASAKWITSFCLAAGLALFVRNSADAGDIPHHVVSINVCTDQLALLLANEGQLRSVSYLSQDPELSVMAVKAWELPVNHAQAEEVFLMKPDLVLAGTFSSRATVELLRRLGIRVEEFAPARTFGDIEDHLRRMGEVFTLRIAGEIARLVSTLGGLDALIFTAGIGENQPEIRAAVCLRLSWLGIDLNISANNRNTFRITTNSSRTAAFVLPTDEERIIALETLQVLENSAA